MYTFLKKATAYTAFTLVGVGLLAGAAQASVPVDSKRINLAEKVRLTARVTIQASGTTVADSGTFVVSPVKGWVTGLWCTPAGGTATVQGASPTQILPKIGGVSATIVSASIVSGTAPGTVIGISTTAPLVSSSNAVSAAQAIQLQAAALPGNTTGLTTAGAKADCTVTVTPNYY